MTGVAGAVALVTPFCFPMTDTNTDTKPLRDARGRMLAPLPGKHTITSADASILARRRWDKVRRETSNRVLAEAQAIDPTVKTMADALALMNSKQYVALMDSEKPQVTQAIKLTEFLTGKEAANSQRANEGAPPNSILLAPATLLDLVQRIEQDKRGAIDKAGAIDGTTTRSGEA